MITKEDIIAEVNLHVDDAIKEGFAPSIGDEAFSTSIIDELVSVGTELPESTKEILFGLLVVFEMRNRFARSSAVIQ